jgi:hypothetical protein
MPLDGRVSAAVTDLGSGRRRPCISVIGDIRGAAGEIALIDVPELLVLCRSKAIGQPREPGQRPRGEAVWSPALK